MKTLMDEYNDRCVLLIKSIQKDGVGGYRSVWADGIEFDAAWEYRSAPEITVAEQQGVERTYGIYVDKTLELEYHDAFRRVGNGQIYRVVNPGTDRMTPTTSRINRRLVEVEKWKLPNSGE